MTTQEGFAGGQQQVYDFSTIGVMTLFAIGDDGWTLPVL